MKVLKRNGQLEEVKFDKITSRIAPFCKDLIIDPVEIAQKIVARIYNNITTIELDKLTCQLCAGMSLIHPDYQKHGIGKALVKKAEERTKNLRFQTITIHTAASNQKMRRFAEKNGFDEVEYLPKFWGEGTEDAYLLSKRVD